MEIEYEILNLTERRGKNHGQTNAWKDHLTFVRLPGVMLSPEDTERANYLRTSIQDYINAQSASFIAGRRSLDEFDDYQEELKNLGIEEFIGLYQNAYAAAMSPPSRKGCRKSQCPEAGWRCWKKYSEREAIPCV